MTQPATPKPSRTLSAHRWALASLLLLALVLLALGVYALQSAPPAGWEHHPLDPLAGAIEALCWGLGAAAAGGPAALGARHWGAREPSGGQRVATPPLPSESGREG